MAKGPKYRVPFRRRREGKTNYHRRLRLIQSRRNRLVIRASLKHTIVQVVDSKIKGDIILAQSHTKQLEKDFNWAFATSNQPAAYLAGYLCGLRAKKANIDSPILDVGILVHNERVKAAFKGFLDSGMEVPHDEEWFPESLEERVKGIHIENYAKDLKKNNPDKYKKLFSATLKKKGDPTKISAAIEAAKKSMEKKV